MADYALKLPNLGEDAGTEATVNIWHKKVGDAVSADEDILEVTYDKATFFVPSPVAGSLKEIVAREDDVIPVGGTLAIIKTADLLMPFIVFEGPDGGGKSRQLALAADKIDARPKGRRVVRVREPGGTPSGERVREILLATESGALSTATEVFLFMAARAELTAQVIRPALKAGSVVLSDRYLLSSVVYQGVAGGLGAEAVATMGELATGGLTPDLTIVLDVPPDVGLQRRAAGRSHDRMELKGAEYHARVREGFLSLARRDPEHIIVVDGTRPLDDVAAAVWEHVTRVLAHVLD